MTTLAEEYKLLLPRIKEAQKHKNRPLMKALKRETGINWIPSTPLISVGREEKKEPIEI